MTKSDSVQCPCCGSYDVSRFEGQRRHQHPIFGKIYVKSVYYRCHDCTEEVDIFAESDKNYEEAEKQAALLINQKEKTQEND